MFGQEVANVMVRVGADTDHFEKGMSGVEKKLGLFGRAAGGVSAFAVKSVAVAAGAFLGLGTAMGGALSAGSEVEEMMGKFNVVFGDFADQAAGELDVLGKSVGRNKNELRGFAATFQDTFVPLGFARGEAAGLSTELTELAVDMASFNDSMEPDVVRDLQSALVGNHETMRKYGVIITQAALDQTLLEMGFDGGAKAATEQQKVMARLNLIMEGTTDAQGDASRTSASWANTMRDLQAVLKETWQNIGQRLLPVMTPLLAQMRDAARTIGPVLVEHFSRIISFIASPAVGARIGAMVKSLKDLGKTLIRVGRPLKEALGGLFTQLALAQKEDGFSGIVKVIAGALQKLGGVFMGWAKEIWSKHIKPGLSDAWKGLTSWVTDEEKRKVLLENLGTKWDQFKEWAQGVWAVMKPGLSDAWAELTSWVTDEEKRKVLFENLKTKWDQFKKWAKDVWVLNIKPGLSAAWAELTSWVTDEEKRKGLLENLKTKWDQFTTWAKGLWAVIKPELVQMYTDMNAWLQKNEPDLHKWTSAFEEFFSGFSIQLEEDAPKRQGRWARDMEHMKESIEGIMNALKVAFGGDDAVGGMSDWGRFFAMTFQIMGDSVIAFVKSSLKWTQLFLEGMNIFIQAMKKLMEGDFAGAGPLFSRWWDMQMFNFGADVDEAQQVWDDFVDGMQKDWMNFDWDRTDYNIPPARFAPSGAVKGMGGASSKLEPIGRSTAINISISGDGGALPRDRGRLQELARMIWREAEMQGMRLR